ncbi:MAG: hypothetical protein V7K88_00435 [Nostoc sp.]|uniref:hypothetical protein n=1 Tax=Nostoc sp. TaxID=1180 RepID=UPI002FF9D526
MLNTRVQLEPMLDYVSAGMAFYVTILPVQEWILEFRLGYLGRYWSLISVAGLFIGFLLCALIFLPLIINMTLDPFKFPDHLVMSAIAYPRAGGDRLCHFWCNTLGETVADAATN